MNKRIISKVGKRHIPEIDMIEYMQTDELLEFDLDRDLFDDKPINPVKKKTVREDVENEHNDQLVDIIENNEV